MADDGYPPSSFYFKVVFAATRGMSDTSFQDVSGIVSRIETEPYNELGENGYVYQLPKSITSDNLVLKRGIASSSSPLVKWCSEIFGGDFTEPIVPTHMLVYLMNEYKIPIRAWSFDNAYPVSWAVEPFNSTKNEVAIEKIELKYNIMSRII